MVKGGSNHPDQDAKDKESDSDTRAVDSREEDNVPTNQKKHDTKYKDQEKWPHRLMAIVSVLLLGVTYDYTCSTKKQVELTRDSLEVTRESLEVTRESFEVSRDAFLLDRRPWVGYYGYRIQARKHSTARWEDREPRIGEEFRIRCSIHNTGKTPALNLFMFPIVVRLDSVGDFTDAHKWSGGQEGRGILFPNAEDFSHSGEAVFLTDEEFSDYYALKKEIFFWAALSYKDIAGELYFVGVAVSHSFGTDSYKIRSSFDVPVSAVAQSGKD